MTRNIYSMLFLYMIWILLKMEDHYQEDSKEQSCLSQGQSHGNAHKSLDFTVDSAVREGSYRHVYTQDTQRVLGEVQCELGHRGVASQLCFRVFFLLPSMANVILQCSECVFKWNDMFLCLLPSCVWLVDTCSSVRCVFTHCPHLRGVFFSSFAVGINTGWVGSSVTFHLISVTYVTWHNVWWCASIIHSPFLVQELK